MSVLDARKTKAHMEQKGFIESNGDHKYLEFHYNGKLTRCRTKISHSASDLDDYLIGCMAKQIKLTKKQFKEFALCTLTEEGYIKILKDQSII